jgi:putative transposase
VATTPTGTRAEIRDSYCTIFDTTDLTVESGPPQLELVEKRMAAFAAKYDDRNPAARRILTSGSDGLEYK